MTIGQKIRECRKIKNLTQKKLADLSDVSIVSIQQYERAVRTPHIIQLKKIAAALDISVNDLLDNTVDVTNMPLGEKLRELRKSRELTQKKLSSMSGVAEITIRKYENGDRNAGIKQIQKIAESLNVSVNSLLDDRPNTKTAPDYLRYITGTVDDDNMNLLFDLLKEGYSILKMETGWQHQSTRCNTLQSVPVIIAILIKYTPDGKSMEEP